MRNLRPDLMSWTLCTVVATTPTEPHFRLQLHNVDCTHRLKTDGRAEDKGDGHRKFTHVTFSEADIAPPVVS